MTDEEAAKFYYEHRDDPELEGTEVKVETSERLSRVVSVRFSPEEARVVQKHARAAGLTVSAYVRRCALEGSALSEAERSLLEQLADVSATVHRIERKIGA
jgi:hypothetical protein